MVRFIQGKHTEKVQNQKPDGIILFYQKLKELVMSSRTLFYHLEIRATMIEKEGKF